MLSVTASPAAPTIPAGSSPRSTTDSPFAGVMTQVGAAMPKTSSGTMPASADANGVKILAQPQNGAGDANVETDMAQMPGSQTVKPALTTVETPAAAADAEPLQENLSTEGMPKAGSTHPHTEQSKLDPAPLANVDQHSAGTPTPETTASADDETATPEAPPTDASADDTQGPALPIIPIQPDITGLKTANKTTSVAASVGAVATIALADPATAQMSRSKTVKPGAGTPQHADNGAPSATIFQTSTPTAAQPLAHAAGDNIAITPPMGGERTPSNTSITALPQLPAAGETGLAARDAVEIAWAEQAARTAMAKFDGGFTQARFRLTPEALGTVDISVSFDAGTPQVSFAVANDAAKAALDGALNRLGDMLERNLANGTANDRTADSDTSSRQPSARQDEQASHDRRPKGRSSDGEHITPLSDIQNEEDGRIRLFA